MNTPQTERVDHVFPQQCRICGGGINESDEAVFFESEEDAEYDHKTCLPN